MKDPKQQIYLPDGKGGFQPVRLTIKPAVVQRSFVASLFPLLLYLGVGWLFVAWRVGRFDPGDPWFWSYLLAWPVLMFGWILLWMVLLAGFGLAILLVYDAVQYRRRARVYRKARGG